MITTHSERHTAHVRAKRLNEKCGEGYRYDVYLCAMDERWAVGLYNPAGIMSLVSDEEETARLGR